MMDRLREGVNSIAVKIILGLVILSFVFAGVGGYLGGGNNSVAAKVGSTEIYLNSFEQVYQQERNRMQEELGEGFSNLLADPNYVQSFRKSVLDRMINDELLEQHAQTLGLRISDEQIVDVIATIPQFQKDGKFDSERYQAELRRGGYTADSFAESLRSQLTRNQLLTAVQNTEFTLPSEIEAVAQLSAQERTIRSLTLSVDEFAKNVEITDAEVEEYYQQNSGNYVRPEEVKAAYIELQLSDLEENITISDEQARTYYEQNPNSFYLSEGQRKVSHIFVRGEDKNKAQALLDELNNGADFSTLAKEKSEDTGSAQEGGSLGWIERDAMDIDFELAAFALENAGDTSGLVKSQMGYHIIRLDDSKEAVLKSYEDVASEIIAQLKNDQAVELYYSLKNELENVAFESPDSLDEAAKVISATIHTTDFISPRSGNRPIPLLFPIVMETLYSPEVKDKRENSKVIDISDTRLVVVRVDDVREEVVLPLTEVKESVVAQLARTKGEQEAITLGEQLVEALNKGDTAILAEKSLAFDEATEVVTRNSPLANVIFALPKPEDGKVSYEQAKQENGDVIVIELSKVESTTTPEINEQVKEQLAKMNEQQNLVALLNMLRNKTNIQYIAVKP